MLTMLADIYEHVLMSQLHLRQPGFTYSACELFAKHHERI